MEMEDGNHQRIHNVALTKRRGREGGEVYNKTSQLSPNSQKGPCPFNIGNGGGGKIDSSAVFLTQKNASHRLSCCV